VKGRSGTTGKNRNIDLKRTRGMKVR